MSASNPVETLASVELLLKQYSDVFRNEGGSHSSFDRLPTATGLQAELTKVQEEGRILTIGIVGRVKAGKSSLLNALLFEGRDVLPKAATPMTAALSVMTHGPLAAKVEFYSQADCDQIRDDARDYEARLKAKVKEILDRQSSVSPAGPEVGAKEDAHRQAKKDLESHPGAASLDHWHAMNAGPGGEALIQERTRVLQAQTLSELQLQLAEFVGVGGRFNAYTKSVELSLPEPGLEALRIVDTPGLNDPVQSREQRTKEYLHQCDVVFVVSPSGQFLQKNDLDLMERLASHHAVKHIYLVASQADNALLDPSIIGPAEAIPTKACEIVRKKLLKVAQQALRRFVEDHPELGETFSSIVDALEATPLGPILLTSALSQALERSVDEMDRWDEEMHHLWKRLQATYPDHFTKAVARANLKALANIDGVHEVISRVREDKDSILADRTQEILQAAGRKVRQYLEELEDRVAEAHQLLKTADLASIGNRRDKLRGLIASAAAAVDEVFDSALVDATNDIVAEIRRRSDVLFGDSLDTVQAQRTSETESYLANKEGLGNWFARILWGGGKERRTRQVVQVSASAVSAALFELRGELRLYLTEVVEQSRSEWTKGVRHLVGAKFRASVGDENVDEVVFQSGLRLLSGGGAEWPTFDADFSNGNLGAKWDAVTGKSGILSNHEAEEYMDQARSLVSGLKTSFLEEAARFRDELRKKMRKVAPSEVLMKGILQTLANLESDLANKELSMTRLKELKKALSVLEV